MKITIGVQNIRIAALETENQQLIAKMAKMKRHIGSLKKQVPKKDDKIVKKEVEKVVQRGLFTSVLDYYGF